MLRYAHRKASVWLMIFRRKYADMILNREKDIEIRWIGTKNVEKVKPGDYILIMCKLAEGIIGIAKVVNVCIKSIKDITEEDAIRAGFSSKENMINELLQLYPIRDLEEKYYLIKLIPLIDLRGTPIKLRDLGLNITYNDLRGKIIRLDTQIINKILMNIRRGNA